MSGLHAASCVSLGRRMGALGFVLACMAIWHTATLQEFRVGTILLFGSKFSCVLSAYESHPLYSYGGIKRDRIDVDGF
jgi:hypothetical protein